jgi:tRNA A37 threonylcarbamoyltransferase TsaD
MQRGAARGLPVFVPRLGLSTDNAAMIATAGLRRFRAGVRGGMDMNADASLPLTNAEPRTSDPEPRTEPEHEPGSENGAA